MTSLRAVIAMSPSQHFLTDHPAHWLALGAGAGLSRLAPGTIGTLWGWLLFSFIHHWLPSLSWGWVIGCSLLVGIWACTLTARALKKADPSCVVWDEIVAFWLVLWVLTPCSFGMQLAAFILFRFFDAAKPGPVGWADRRFKITSAEAPITWAQGWGILWDDLVAAFCTLFTLALLVRIWS